MKKVLLFILLLLILGCGLVLFYPQDNKEEKIEEPLNVSIKESKIIIPFASTYTKENNLIIDGRTKDTTIDCSPTVLKIGKNDIKCTVKNSSSTKEIGYSLIYSSTYNKSAIFFGDSITAGFGSKSRHYSWANYIKDNYDLNNVVNAGISDYRLSTYDNPSKWLVNEVKSHYQDKDNYDYIIMQGGVNDLFYATPMIILMIKTLLSVDLNYIYMPLKTNGQKLK